MLHHAAGIRWDVSFSCTQSDGMEGGVGMGERGSSGGTSEPYCPNFKGGFTLKVSESKA